MKPEGRSESANLHIYIYICHLADAFIQSDFQSVLSTMRVQTQNNKNRESTISSKQIYKVL